MSKPQTIAALELVSQDSDGNITLSTAGTKAAPGAKLTSWSTPWGDGTSIFGSGKPPATINHKYLQDGDYLATLSVLDNKNKKAIASQMIIVRISPPPPPTTPPNILSVSPGSGNIGDPIVVTGTNFGSTQGTSKVYFNGTLATVDSWSGTSINVHVPIGATTGQVTVVVANESSNGVTFTVTGAQVYDFIVANGGIDGPTHAGSLADPFATITYALQRAAAVLSGTGKTIGVRGFTYNQAVINPGTSGTSWTNKLRVVNYNSEVVVLRPISGAYVTQFENNTNAFIELDGINQNGSALASYDGVFHAFGNSTFDNHDIRLLNVELQGKNATHAYGIVFCGPGLGLDATTYGKGFQFISCTIHTNGVDQLDHAFYCSGSNLRVDNCEIYDFTGGGIQIYNGTNPSSITGDVIVDCRIHNPKVIANAHWGIIDCGTGSIIYNCEIFDIQDDGNQAVGIQAFGSINGQYYFNTIVRCKIGIDLANPTNALLQNNIAYNNALNFQPSGTYTETNNSMTGTNPQFVGLTDFHLTALTPASIVTGGVAIPGITTDKDGNFRPDPPSIGAHQYP